jgi:hypothetical protein
VISAPGSITVCLKNSYRWQESRTIYNAEQRPENNGTSYSCGDQRIEKLWGREEDGTSDGCEDQKPEEDGISDSCEDQRPGKNGTLGSLTVVGTRDQKRMKPLTVVGTGDWTRMGSSDSR